MPKRRPAEILKAHHIRGWDEGTFLFHSSRFGGCIHGQVLSLLGKDIPEPSMDLQTIFKEGHEAEAEIKKSLNGSYITLEYASDDYEDQLQAHVSGDCQDGTKYVISCHPDGILNLRESFDGYRWKESGYRLLDSTMRKYQGDTQIYVFEHKNFKYTSYDKFVNSGLEYFPNYSWQISIQAQAVKNYFNLDYIPKVFFSVEYKHDWGSHRVCRIYESPPYDAEEIHYRATSIIDIYKSISERKELKEDDLMCDHTKYCEFLR